MDIPNSILIKDWDEQAKLILLGYKKRLKGEINHDYVVERMAQIFTPEFEILVDSWTRETLFNVQSFNVIEEWFRISAIKYYNDLRFLNALLGVAGCCGRSEEPLVQQVLVFGDRWIKPNLDFRSQFLSEGRINQDMPTKLQTRFYNLQFEFNQMVKGRI